MDLDRLSPSELVKYQKYREKLRHLYVCTNCSHSFERDNPQTKCIFCSGPLKELERDDVPTAKRIFRYICTSCQHSFVAEHAEVCKYCNSKYLHFYEATHLNTREILSMRKRQITERLGNAARIIKISRSA